MNLYFKCPIKKEIFESCDYRLHEDHRVVEDAAGERRLEGSVILTSGCPLCGENHRYQVREILCSLDGKKR